MSGTYIPPNLTGLSRDELESRVITLDRELFNANRERLTDPLTKLGNRRKLEYDYNKLSLRKTDGIVGLLLVDIDHFKKINDTYGHIVGDHALACLAHELSLPLRAGDMLYRFGGEEIVILLLPHGDDSSNAATLEIADCALREQKHIATVKWWKMGVPPLTVSVGFAQGNYSTPLETLLRQADKAMYRAKERGRNQVAGGTGLIKTLPDNK